MNNGNTKGVQTRMERWADLRAQVEAEIENGIIDDLPFPEAYEPAHGAEPELTAEELASEEYQPTEEDWADYEEYLEEIGANKLSEEDMDRMHAYYTCDEVMKHDVNGDTLTKEQITELRNDLQSLDFLRMSNTFEKYVSDSDKENLYANLANRLNKYMAQVDTYEYMDQFDEMQANEKGYEQVLEAIEDDNGFSFLVDQIDSYEGRLIDEMDIATCNDILTERENEDEALSRRDMIFMNEEIRNELYNLTDDWRKAELDIELLEIKADEVARKLEEEGFKDDADMRNEVPAYLYSELGDKNAFELESEAYTLKSKLADSKKGFYIDVKEYSDRGLKLDEETLDLLGSDYADFIEREAMKGPYTNPEFYTTAYDIESPSNEMASDMPGFEGTLDNLDKVLSVGADSLVNKIDFSKDMDKSLEQDLEKEVSEKDLPKVKEEPIEVLEEKHERPNRRTLSVSIDELDTDKEKNFGEG